MRRNRGSIRTFAVVTLCVGTLAAMAAAAVSGMWRWQPTPPAPASNMEVVQAFSRLGVSPEALAAAGVSAEQTQVMLTAVRTHLEESIGQFRRSDRTLGAAQDQLSRLNQSIGAGRATVMEKSSLDTLRQNVTTARGERHSLTENLRAAATQNLTETQRSTLLTIQRNRSHGLPVEYLVVDRTGAEWTLLGDAIAVTHAQTPVLQHPRLAAALSEANSATPVQQARQGLQNKAAIDAIFTTLLSSDQQPGDHP